jgi:hypothetical protein
MEWWHKIDDESLGSVQKGLNSLIILGAWTLWKHHNRCVFDGIAPRLAAAISQAEEEKRTWELEPRGSPSWWHSSEVTRSSIGRLSSVD